MTYNKKQERAGYVSKDLIYKLLLIFLSAIFTFYGITKANTILGLVSICPVIFIIQARQRGCWAEIFLFTIILSVFLFYWILDVAVRYAGNYTSTAFTGVLICSVVYSSSLVLVFALFSLFQKPDENNYKLKLINGLTLGIIWMLIEELRGIVFSGFPYLDLRMGYAFAGNTWLIQWAGLFGARILTLLVVFMNWILVGVIINKRQPKAEKLIPAFMFIILLIGGWGLKLVFDQLKVPGDTHKVTLISHNLSPEVVWSPQNEKELVGIYTNLNATALRYKPELIIWTESAIPWKWTAADPFVRELVRPGQEMGVDQLLGVNRVDKPGSSKIFNSAVLISPDNKICKYDKHDLLSFIETPLVVFNRNFLMPMLEAAGIEIIAGSGNDIIKSKIGQLKIKICNEIVSPFNYTSDQNADLEVLMGNDGWFDKTYIPYLHLMICRIRAVESGKNLLININRGYSGVVNSTGEFTQLKSGRIPGVNSVEIASIKNARAAHQLSYLVNYLSVLVIVLMNKLVKQKK